MPLPTKTAKSLIEAVPLRWTDDQWRWPNEDLVIECNPARNIEQRIRLLTQAEDNPVVQADIMRACQDCPEFFFGMFLWTEVVHEHGPDGKHTRAGDAMQPFILWPIQQELMRAIMRGVDKAESVGVRKARDMGASWVCLGTVLHMTMFRKDFKTLLLSRKEDLVDQPGNPDSLFHKLRYMIDRLPEWMHRPKQTRFAHIECAETGAVIDGESTNADASRGGRRDLIVIDEAAAIGNLRQIAGSSSQTARCRVFNSTPKRGSYFSHLIRSGTLKVVQMPWWTHPGKGQGRKVHTTEDGKTIVTAPWYEHEKSLLADPQAIAEELDMDDEGGMGVFDANTLSSQEAAYVKTPARGFLRVQHGRFDAMLPVNRQPRMEWSVSENGPWRWWGPLAHDRQKDWLRPPQRTRYVIGVDIGLGTGGNDSVASVMDANTGMKVGRFTSNTTTPTDFAEHLYAVCEWIGGTTEPMIVPESNGVGQAFVLRLRELGYPRIYRHRDDHKLGSMRSDVLGWHSTRERKRTALEQYRAALAKHEFRNPDAEALEQCRAYVYYSDGGGVGPVSLAQMTQEERAQHGDMVIADMLAYLGWLNTPVAE